MIALDRLLVLLACLLCVIGAACAAEPAHIVFMIGEDEYRTAETLPEFAEKELKPLGHRISIVTTSASDPNDFTDIIATLRDADLLFLSVRRRTPPRAQLDAVRAYVASGKPLIGIRTASHAFALRGQEKPADPKLDAWQKFDPEVLGGNYVNHHGNEKIPDITVAAGNETHPILRSVEIGALKAHGSLYQVRPLENGTTPLLIGTIAGEPPEPVAWTRLLGPREGRIFYTSLGHLDDFQNTAFRRLLVNAVTWALHRPNGNESQTAP